MDSMRAPQIPTTIRGIGYTRQRDGLPLEEIQVPVPQPAAGQVLIHVVGSSLNPLEYKLAELNFFGRTPPVMASIYPASSSPPEMRCATSRSATR